MFADQVGHARDSTRTPMYRFDRLRTKNFFSVAAGNAQPFENKSAGLLRCERQRLGAELDALAKLPEFSLIQFLLDLRLSGKHDLQKFFGRSLEVGQQPN